MPCPDGGMDSIGRISKVLLKFKVFTDPYTLLKRYALP